MKYAIEIALNRIIPKEIKSIIYWSSERALESKNTAIFQLYSSYEDFVKDCITTKPPHGQA